MSINIKPSYEGKFYEWAKALQGQEIPMSKIKGERSPDPAVRKEARFADSARHWNHKSWRDDRYSDSQAPQARSKTGQALQAEDLWKTLSGRATSDFLTRPTDVPHRRKSRQ
jgi:hypothetical protein